MEAQIKVLFICTANACRSQMAEALLRHLDPVRFETHSAGIHPAGYIHPLAMAAMEALDVPMTGQYSKGWHEFEHEPLDLVITVCSAAAQEICPVWPADALTVNWPLPDPVGYFGSDSERRDFAVQIAKRMKEKLERLVALDFQQLPRGELRERLEEIGRD